MGTLRQRAIDLRGRLAGLEAELARAQGELLSAAPGEPLPGTYLRVDAAGERVLLPAVLVREIVRLVTLSPIAGAPPHVLGTFVHRGQPVLAVDVARCLGVTRELALDAHVVVLGASVAVALVVDRVRGLVDDPVAVAPAASAELSARWRASGLAEGLCRSEEGPLVLLSLPALTRSLEVGA